MRPVTRTVADESGAADQGLKFEWDQHIALQCGKPLGGARQVGVITRRGPSRLRWQLERAQITPLPDRSSSAAAHAKSGQRANSAIGSCLHAVTASWAIICLAQLTQVDGQAGRDQGVGVVLAQDAAAAVEGVLIQDAGGLYVAQLAQVVGQVGG